MLHKLAVSFHQITLSTAFSPWTKGAHTCTDTHAHAHTAILTDAHLLPFHSHLFFSLADLIYYTRAGILELNEPLNGNYILPPVTPLIQNMGSNCPNCLTPFSPPSHILSFFYLFFFLSHLFLFLAAAKKHKHRHWARLQPTLVGMGGKKIMEELNADACIKTLKDTTQRDAKPHLLSFFHHISFYRHCLPSHFASTFIHYVHPLSPYSPLTSPALPFFSLSLIPFTISSLHLCLSSSLYHQHYLIVFILLLFIRLVFFFFPCPISLPRLLTHPVEHSCH